MANEHQLSAQSRLDLLVERLLAGAEKSLAAGELESARATVEEVRAVDPDNPRMRGMWDRLIQQERSAPEERALMTLLFSDLVGSTALSERLEPEQMREIFARYRAEVIPSVERYRGNIMQFAGDGVLAGFGYPLTHEDDARRAILAALDLVSRMRAARSDLLERFGVDLEVRVGIHTGRVVVTDLRETGRLGELFSVVGMATNLAARIQQAAEPDAVVISDVTQQLVEADFDVHTLGLKEFKGISRPVEVFMVEGARHISAKLDAERYRTAQMVGREEARARLASAWEEVVFTDPTHPASSASFLITGEAGIGKTRLVASIRNLVMSSGGYVLGTACLPYYVNISLWPIVQMLQRDIGVGGDGGGDDLTQLVESLAHKGLDPPATVPFLAPLLGVAPSDRFPAPELEPSAFLDETLNQIVDWIEASARSAPTLLIVEDLHWADPSTLAVLGRVVSRGPGQTLTLSTTREPTTISWKDAAQMIRLDRLDQESSGDLVDELSVGRRLGVGVKQSIIIRADGIPLFLEELTRAAVESETGEILPLRLQELLTGRLKAPGHDLRVAQVAATIGPSFETATVAAVMGDEARTGDQLRRFSEAGLLESDETGAATYRFRHALLRDAAYETQTLDTRKLTHARIADVLVGQRAAAALIAEHLVLAGESERAVPQYLIAGQEAQARGAHTEATRLLTSALDLIESLPDSDERDLTELTLRMLRALSVSSMQGYAAPEVQEDHRTAEVLATRLGTRPEVLPSLIAIWSYWLVSGEIRTAAAVVDRLTSMTLEPTLAWFEPEVDSCVGWQAFHEGALEKARTHQRRAIAGYESRSPEMIVSPFWPLPNDPLAISQIALACVEAVMGDRVASTHWEEAALHRARDIGFPRGPFSEAFVLTMAAWIRQLWGDDVAARELGTRVVQIGQEYGYAYWTTLGLLMRAAEKGDVSEPDFLEETIAALRLLGQGLFIGSNLAHLAKVRAGAGERDRAIVVIEEGIRAVHESGELLHLPELLRLRGSYQIERGNINAGIADLSKASRVAAAQGANLSHLRAAIAIARVEEASRPNGWRTALEEAKTRTPDGPELAEANSLLTG